MTDDKGAGEEIYKHSTYCHATDEFSKCLGCAFAKMENDFRELLHFANVMSEILKADSHSPGFEMRFIEWKKERGLE